jgi:hypothetical protein
LARRLHLQPSPVTTRNQVLCRRHGLDWIPVKAITLASCVREKRQWKPFSRLKPKLTFSGQGQKYIASENERSQCVGRVRLWEMANEKGMEFKPLELSFRSIPEGSRCPSFQLLTFCLDYVFISPQAQLSCEICEGLGIV